MPEPIADEKRQDRHGYFVSDSSASFMMREALSEDEEEVEDEPATCKKKWNSAMSNNSIIEHRGNYHFVPLREEFLIICMNCKYRKPDTEKSKNKASPYCKALILAIMEGWTNDKRGTGSLAVFMTYRQWADSMYGMFGRNVIIDSLDELLGERLLAREPYKMYGKDTFQYFLNFRELNRRIKDLPEKPANEKFPQSFYDPFTSKPDEDTDLQVNATHLPVNATGLLVNDDPFISNHNIDTTQKHKDSQREREASSNMIDPPTPSLSPSLAKKSSSPEPGLLSTLSDEQADFWTRWCALAGTRELNATAIEHIKVLAPEVKTTQHLQMLYDLTYDALQELAQAQGRKVVAPSLGNLVKKLSDLRAVLQRQAKEQEEAQTEEQAAHSHRPGTGRIANWTTARINGEAPPVDTQSTSIYRPKREEMDSIATLSPMWQAQLEKRRRTKEKSQS